MKKILAVMLTLVMVLSFASVLSFNAAEKVELKADYTIEKVGEKTMMNIVVSIDTKENYANGITVNLNFDTAKVSLADVAWDEATNSGTMTLGAFLGSYVAAAEVVVGKYDNFALAKIGDDAVRITGAVYSASKTKNAIGSGVLANITVEVTGELTECPFSFGDITLVGGADGSASSPLEYNANVIIPDADYAALDAAIAKTTDLVEADYTADTWTALQTALTAANAAKQFDSFKQADITAAAQALEAAITALKVTPKKALEAAIAAADAVDAGKYIEDEAWTSFQTALTSAKATLANEEATDDDYVSATEALEAAYAEINPNTSALSLTIVAVMALLSLICAAFVISKKVRA